MSNNDVFDSNIFFHINHVLFHTGPFLICEFIVVKAGPINKSCIIHKKQSMLQMQAVLGPLVSDGSTSFLEVSF